MYSGDPSIPDEQVHESNQVQDGDSGISLIFLQQGQLHVFIKSKRDVCPANHLPGLKEVPLLHLGQGHI